MKKERESGIELLRIILMLQVIFLHICSYGTYSKFGAEAGGLHSLLYWFTMMLSRTPVYLYIVIMGYFMINKELTMKDAFQKIKSVYLVVLFYSLGIWLVFAILGAMPFDFAKHFQMTYKPVSIFKALLPITARNWPFMTTYILVLFFAPFINRGLKDIPKRTYQLLIAVLFFLFSIWILLSKLPLFNEVFKLSKIINNDDGKSLYGMLFMYILGGYIRRFTIKHEKAQVRYLVYALLLVILNVFLTYQWPDYRKIVCRNDNPISILLGAMYLMYFKDLKFRSKAINTIAKHNIGVYIIHEDFLMRTVLWTYIIAINPATFYATKWYPAKFLGIGIAIFAVCACIDALRERLFTMIGGFWDRRKKKI